MKYSIALTLVKGLSPKILNEIHALNKNEKELFEKLVFSLTNRKNIKKQLQKPPKILPAAPKIDEK